MSFSPCYRNGIRLPVGRVLFCHLEKPRASQRSDGSAGDAKYDITIMIPKEDQGLLKNAAAKAMECLKESFGVETIKDALARQFKWVLRPGESVLDKDGKPYENAEGMICITARSKRLPLLVDRKRTELKPDAIYPGCYVALSVDFGSFNKEGGKGVTTFVQGVQFQRDGERLGAPIATVDDMFDFDSAGDDPNDYPDDPESAATEEEDLLG